MAEPEKHSAMLSLVDTLTPKAEMSLTTKFESGKGKHHVIKHLPHPLTVWRFNLAKESAASLKNVATRAVVPAYVLDMEVVEE